MPKMPINKTPEVDTRHLNPDSAGLRWINIAVPVKVRTDTGHGSPANPYGPRLHLELKVSGTTARAFAALEEGVRFAGAVLDDNRMAGNSRESVLKYVLERIADELGD